MGKFAVFAALVFAVSCGGDGQGDGGSLAGSYECVQPGSTVPDAVELGADGTLTIGQGEETFEGTWAAEGDAGSFNPGGQEEETFTVTDGRIIFGDGTTCTKKA